MKVLCVYAILVYVFSLCTMSEVSAKQLMMRIIVPSRNNAPWVQKNLTSIAAQMETHQNFDVFYVDDQSTDGTSELVESYVEELGLRSRTHIIHNAVRQGALKNIYDVVWETPSEYIIVLLDGDDWFYRNNVLQELNTIYSSPKNKILLTYGLFVEYPSGFYGWSKEIPTDIIQANAFRSFKPHPSHLRTFYAWLFKLIKKEDLLDSEGNFYPMTWDQAIMFPMCEMAGRHIKFVQKFNYVYNQANPIQDNKVNAELQNSLEREIRHKIPYQPLTDYQICMYTQNV